MRPIVRPIESDLKMNKSFDDMVKFIDGLLATGTPLEIAQKASVAYLTVIIAFENRGLIDRKWIPPLVIEISNQEFEEMEFKIHLSTQTASEHLAMDNLDQHMPTDTSLASQVIPKMHTNSELSQSSVSSHQRPNVGTLLRTLQDFQVPAGELEGLRGEIRHAEIAIASAQDNARSTGRILEKMRQLDRLEEQSKALSVSTNVAYWQLGQAVYKHRGEDALKLDKNRQAALLNELCQDADTEVVSSKTARARYQKRLIRARKFCILVKIFGQPVLACHPIVCVTKIDSLRLADLVGIEKGSAERAKVEGFKKRHQLLVPLSPEGAVVSDAWHA